MTKFQRAKKQTIKKWKNILWSWIDEKPVVFCHCGFCQEYMVVSWVEDACTDCPIYANFGDNCTNDVLDTLKINQFGYGVHLSFSEGSKEIEIDRQIPLAMAVLIYLEQMRRKNYDV